MIFSIKIPIFAFIWFSKSLIFCSEFRSYVKVVVNMALRGDTSAQIDCYALGE